MTKRLLSADARRPDPSGDAPSKSQRKRELHTLQELGKRLVELPLAELERLQMPERVSAAVVECRGIRSHGARRRQLRWIGKLLSQCDRQRIEALFDGIDSKARAEQRRHQALERWRHRLLEEGDAALEEFIGCYPAAEWQQLRNLVRTARNELQRGRPPAASRRLFRYLRELGVD